MAEKHFQRLPLIRSCFCLVDSVECSGRKLIIFVLLQLLLSPFILITGDNTNERVHHHSAPAAAAASTSEQFRNLNDSIISNMVTMANANNITNRLIKNTIKSNAIMPQFNDENSILSINEINAPKQNAFDDNNLSTMNILSMADQSQLANKTCNSGQCKWQQNNDADAKANEKTFNDGHSDRVLSRKRRYLIFPPGSSMQIGNLPFFSQN